MAITTWAGYLAQLTRLLDGDEISNSIVTTATLEQVISLAETRIYREIRCRWNERDFSACTVNDNRAPVPNDFESPSIVHFGGSQLQAVTEPFLIDQRYITEPRYFAIAGDSFTFAAAVVDGAQVQGRYYCRLPALNSATLPNNDLFLNESNLFIFAALSAGAPFYGLNAMQPIWEAQYTSLRESINRAAFRSAYSVGRLQMRPSARIDPLPYYPSPVSTSDTTYVDTDYVTTDYAV
jgi:hypothetical protein